MLLHFECTLCVGRRHRHLTSCLMFVLSCSSCFVSRLWIISSLILKDHSILSFISPMTAYHLPPLLLTSQPPSPLLLQSSPYTTSFLPATSPLLPPFPPLSHLQFKPPLFPICRVQCPCRVPSIRKCQAGLPAPSPCCPHEETAAGGKGTRWPECGHSRWGQRLDTACIHCISYHSYHSYHDCCLSTDVKHL